MSCESEHHHGHGHGDDHNHVAPIPTLTAQSLYLVVDTARITALNLSNEKDQWPKLFKPSNDRYQVKPVFKLDCDEQIIINVPFLNSSAKLFSLILRTNGTKYCPRKIKLWKNDLAIDFDLVADKKPLYEIEHPQVGTSYDDEDELPDELRTDDFVEHFLPRHIFTGVQLLTIFVESIHGDEGEAHLHSIELRGEATHLTRDPVITLYELAANPKDHKVAEVAHTAAYY